MSRYSGSSFGILLRRNTWRSGGPIIVSGVSFSLLSHNLYNL